VGCVHAKFFFEQAPPLERLSEQLRERTGLDLSLRIVRIDAPRSRYDSAATLTLPSGESVELMHASNQIGVEYLPSSQLQDYLSQATLALVADAGGSARFQAPAWASRRYESVPKRYLVLRAILGYLQLALGTALLAPFVFCAALFDSHRNSPPKATPKRP